MSDVARILSHIEAGDPQAAEQLLPLVYDELRKLATAYLSSEKVGQTLQATGLVHEAYLRLVGSDPGDPQWENRRHFFVAAAESMRRILVERARHKRRVKHGGQFARQTLHDVPEAEVEFREDILELDEALARLAQANRPAADVVQLRYFAGMTMREISVTLGVSERSAARLWDYAKCWLLREIGGPEDPHQE